MIKSKIYLTEVVENKKFRFGQTDHYYPCFIEGTDGTFPALFTKDQIEVAMKRAETNLEDAPKDVSWLEKLFGFGGD